MLLKGKRRCAAAPARHDSDGGLWTQRLPWWERVVSDTGGLDIKPAAGMKLMKKDMGGAAHVLVLPPCLWSQRFMRFMLIPVVEK